MTAAERIAESIRKEGRISFAAYMEIALYDPEGGYYPTRASIGRGGDFYTSVSVGPAFGRVLAGQFQEMWEILGRPRPFTLVEQGANDGRLLADILAAVPSQFRDSIQCRIIEPLPSMSAIQEGLLGNPGVPIDWHPSLAELPPFEGVHFSNELVDAFPFHLMVSTGSGWEEIFVTVGAGGLEFIHGEPSHPVRGHSLPPLPAGFIAELRPAVSPWISSIASRLRRGYLLVTDYGDTRDSLLDGSRPRGTFACYFKHHRDENPLETPGHKDITAHVDFSSLEESGRQSGLHPAGFTDQCRFLTGAAEQLLREMDGRPDHSFLRQLKTLLHPESMGAKFRAFCMKAPGTPDTILSGFRHGKPSCAK